MALSIKAFATGNMKRTTTASFNDVNNRFVCEQKVINSLLLCQFINLATLVLELHPLYIVFALSAILIQWLNFRPRKSTTNKAETLHSHSNIVSKWLLISIAIAGCILLAVTGRELGLLSAMIHLLCFAYSLKLFEISSRKDIYQLVILGVFIAATSLIFIQTIYFSLFIISVVFLNFIVLAYYFANTRQLTSQLRLLASLSLYSIPMAVVLFIGFPKIAPFWQVPNVKSNKVGMSDEVRLGDISQLVLSNELAFRVTFEQGFPNQNQLYWRSLVLDSFDGQTWKQTQPNRRDRNGNFTENYDVYADDNIEFGPTEIRYQVITEPSYQSWLFALDLATSKQANIGQRSDFGLFYRGIISQTLSYDVISYPDATLVNVLPENVRRLNTYINREQNPLLIAKGNELAKRYTNKNQLINAVLAEFHNENYRYTLQPPQLNNYSNSLDAFYFQTQAGFCEHYASAFTYLMRAANIPARLVVGYLGGEVNPNGNYMSVLQRDAHAWSEVWLAGQGWVRVDPTAAVNPARVESGFTDSLLQEHEALSSGFFSRPSIKAMRWLMALKGQIDALDYQWTRWVIGYSAKEQNNFLSELKHVLLTLKNLMYFIGIFILVICIYLIVRRFPIRNKQEPLWFSQYHQVLAVLHTAKLSKLPSQTPMQFAEIVAKKRPDIAEDFSLYSACFCQMAYQNKSDQGDKDKRKQRKMTRLYKQLIWQIKYKSFFTLKK